MEGSESEAIFDACDLNPQRFINEVLNSVDDVLNGAFDFFHQEASAVAGPDRSQELSTVSCDLVDACELNPQRFINEVLNLVDDVFHGAFDFFIQEASAVAMPDRSQELAAGVSFLHNLTQGVLDKRLTMWEKYCLRHCFTVPDGFVLPTAQDSSSNELLPHEGHSDSELDSQLDSLRKKIVAAGQESAELQRGIHALEKQSALSNKFDASVAEALQLYENSAQEMYKEIGSSTAKLQQKVQDAAFHSMEEEVGLARVWNQEHIVPNQDISVRLEDVEGSLTHLRSR